MKTTYQHSFTHSTPLSPIVYYHAHQPSFSRETKRKAIIGYDQYINNRRTKESIGGKKQSTTLTNLNLDLTITDTNWTNSRKPIRAELTPSKYAQYNPQKKHTFQKNEKPIIEQKNIRPKAEFRPSPLYIQMNERIENPLNGSQR